MQIANEMVVTLDYTLKDNDGSIIDHTDGRGDFVYLHGAGNIIPGLEDALMGKVSGDKIEVTISPENAYGERNESLCQEVPRDAFEGIDKIEPGMQFQVQGPEGQTHVVTVASVDGDKITVDGNHPLAGVELNFAVTVIDIRSASAEELEHGHVHMPGHDHH